MECPKILVILGILNYNYHFVVQGRTVCQECTPLVRMQQMLGDFRRFLGSHLYIHWSESVGGRIAGIWISSGVHYSCLKRQCATSVVVEGMSCVCVLCVA